MSIDRCERLARLRSLRTLVHAFYGKSHPLSLSLWLAETQEPEDLEAARLELKRFPARDMRKVVTTFLSIHSYGIENATRGSQ